MTTTWRDGHMTSPFYARRTKNRAGPENWTRPTSYFLLFTFYFLYHLICPTSRISRPWMTAVGKSKLGPNDWFRVITTLELSAW